MDNRLAESESLKFQLEEVLNSLSQNISAQNDNMEDCVSFLSQSSSIKNDLLIPEENHKDFKNSLEILCRLPSLFFQFTNNFNAVGSMDTCTMIDKYNKVAAAIEETNEKLAEMILHSEKCIDSLKD